MTTHEPITPPSAPDAYEPQSRTERLEEDASLAGLAVAGAIRSVDVAAAVLIGLLVCPPLAILAVAYRYYSAFLAAATAHNPYLARESDG